MNNNIQLSLDQTRATKLDGLDWAVSYIERQKLNKGDRKMTKSFALKLLKHLSESAKADGNVCKTYDNSAKHQKLKAYTGDEKDYLNHLMEWCEWKRR